MKLYEYKIIPTRDEKGLSTGDLDAQGSEGWELVSVVWLPRCCPIYYFKREKCSR